MNIINGKQADTETARHFLDELPEVTANTLQNGWLDTSIVINAADKLSEEISVESAYPLLSSFGVGRQAAESMVLEAKQFLSRAYLETKLRRELGERPFEVKEMGENAYVKTSPLGVLTHISAGNAAGLPAFSVIEGLLAGNINLLKLPGNDDGLSTTLLQMLIRIEPRLAEYIYVFDLPSTDADSIGKLLAVSDAAAVWGSDFAISGIRSLSPSGLKLIEWGHKLSFECVTKRGESEQALEGIARDICETEQLLCSSPQCVYYEAENFEELKLFGKRLFDVLSGVSASLPPQAPEPGAQADITTFLLLKSLEELFEDKQVLRGDGFSVVVDNDPALCSSPMYRNILVKPMRSLFTVLRDKKGYLQTAGLACAEDESPALSGLLFKCGVCRIVPCGRMSSNYSGEPHDGRFALREYVKTVLCKR